MTMVANKSGFISVVKQQFLIELNHKKFCCFKTQETYKDETSFYNAVKYLKHKKLIRNDYLIEKAKLKKIIVLTDNGILLLRLLDLIE